MTRQKARELVAAAVCAAGCAAAGAAQAQAPASETPAAAPPAAAPPTPAWAQGLSTDSGLPRPPPRDAPAPPALELARRLDIGAGLAFVAKLADEDAGGGDRPSDISYGPTVGLEIHLRIPILDEVEVSPYLIVASHPVNIPDRGLEGVDGPVDGGSVTALCFGARVARTFHVDPVRVWATAGVGYGRMEFARMTAREGGAPAFEIRDRGASFIEFPFGFGAALAVVPRWLSVDLEAAAGPVLNKSGPAWSSARTIDGAGLVRQVGALPEVSATLVAALGISLVL